MAADQFAYQRTQARILSFIGNEFERIFSNQGEIIRGLEILGWIQICAEEKQKQSVDQSQKHGGEKWNS